MSVTQAACALGEHPADLRRAIRNEQIPVVREGRKVRVLTAWVADPAGWRTRHLAAMADQ
ncbi:hypothetical protein OY187_27815 [Mycolicibacterium iranicum]|uniref:Helix-turn-helix domain-containing protein n=2 Tax=Mycolicibacterium iranicum TaxID=912594 RepID=A0ABT4HNU0_MYCIR|nr:hypothetical protein [Mycolicibacterium iranicum]